MFAVQWVTIGTVVGLTLYMIAAIFLDDPPPPPTWAWAVPVLVAPAALAVYWRPAYRVEGCFFFTGMSAVVLGFLGFGWGSVSAPIIGAVTIVAICFAPRDGGWRERWGRDEAEGDGRA
jgi:hypothetical protein